MSDQQMLGTTNLLKLNRKEFGVSAFFVIFIAVSVLTILSVFLITDYVPPGILYSIGIILILFIPYELDRASKINYKYLDNMMTHLRNEEMKNK